MPNQERQNEDRRFRIFLLVLSFHHNYYERLEFAGDMAARNLVGNMMATRHAQMTTIFTLAPMLPDFQEETFPIHVPGMFYIPKKRYVMKRYDDIIIDGELYDHKSSSEKIIRKKNNLLKIEKQKLKDKLRKVNNKKFHKYNPKYNKRFNYNTNKYKKKYR